MKKLIDHLEKHEVKYLFTIPVIAMEINGKEIAELKNKLFKSSRKNGRLEETIITLNNQLVQKNNELALLNERLNSLDIRVAQLQTSVDTLTGQNIAKA